MRRRELPHRMTQPPHPARTPHDSSNRNSATSTANNAGCANPVCSSSLRILAANTTSRTGHPTRHPTRAHTSSNAAANTGNRPYNSRPIPTRCAPCPVNTTPSAHPTDTRDHTRSRLARGQRRQPGQQLLPVRAQHHRPVLEHRPRRRQRATPHPPARQPAIAPRYAANRAACARQRRRRSRRHHPRHHRHRHRPAASRPGSPGRQLARRRGSSRITCALVPLIPNDDTPARRGRSTSRPRPRLGQQLAPHPADQSTCGDGASTCRVARQHPVPHRHAPS